MSSPRDPAATPRRVAALDLGTNTAMLLVAERGRSGELVPVVDRELYPRLGEGLEASGALSPAARARTLAAVRELAEEARSYGAHTLSLVGTSALREGDPGGAFLAELRAIVHDARVIDGEEEARLTTLGALAATGVRGPFVCIDVGGGSTELVVGVADEVGAGFTVELARSLPLGSVRLGGRHASSEEPYLDAYGDARTLLFEALPELRAAGRAVVAVAGSAATVGALVLQAHGRPWEEGARIDARAVDDVCELLVALDLEARARLHPWLAQRADVAPFGAIVLQAALHHLGADELVTSSAGVRWGLAIELLGRP
jgi:exopolyphosphatase/guanosine-5'-triphosphate,3'-diphosphate pyrophosphatase